MEKATTKDFFSYSRDIARDFLQSVMVLDDQAHFLEYENPLDDPKPLTSPQSKRKFTASEESDKTIITPQSEAKSQSKNFAFDPEHQLDAKKVIDKFADNGIACAILRPSDKKEVNLSEKVKALSLKSDILVFDWVLGKGDAEGKTVTKLITDIVSEDLTKESRLRLIAIYTGQSTLKDIIKKLKTEIEQINKKNFLNFEIETPDDYTIKIQSIRICAFTKEGNKDKYLRHDNRVINNEDLPDRLITEFAEMTAGLVSNAALKAFTVLRGETHRVLSRFNVKLDPAFLAHRAMLKEPNDAGKLLSMLIGSDLTALLEEWEVGKATDATEHFDALYGWLKLKEKDGINIRESFKNNNQIPNEEELISLIRHGLPSWSKAATYGISSTKPLKAKLTGKFSGTKEETVESKSAESEFAVLTTFKPEFRLHPPTLLLGTVLKCKKEETYWVCIQALCDCTRVVEDRYFPLLPLVKVGDNDNFNFVLREDDNLNKVKVDFRPYSLRSEKFKPDVKHQVVYAGESPEKGKKKYTFKAEHDNIYEWIGELRFAHAQRIANQFAVQISRVGLDESEWQRLWSPDPNA